MTNSELTKKAKQYAKELMSRELDESIYQYHNFQHVLSMHAQAVDMASHYSLSSDEKANLEIACYLHDTGYSEGKENHEERSAQIMRELFKDDLPEERQDAIANLILATKMCGEVPNGISQQIIRDADCHHLGTKEFFIKTAQLKAEMEKVEGEPISEYDWLMKNLQFLQQHEYFSPIGQALFNDRKRKNILKVQNQLSNLQNYQDQVVEVDQELVSTGEQIKISRADRGIETMFRVTLRNHNNLSVIADNKANIMLSINAIMLSIVLSTLSPKLDTNPVLVMPTIILSIVCVSTIILAVLATRPKISSANYSDEAFLKGKFNLLFFGNFFNLPIQKFEWGVSHLMNHEDLLYKNLTKDLYFLGVVLAKKYRLLWICYNVFVIGIIIAVVSFFLAYMFQEPAVTTQ